MAAVISSTSMLNLLPSCYPSSVYNFNNSNICLPKKTLMPTISCMNKKTTTTTLKISNNKEKSKYNNVNIVSSSSSSTRLSPWLMLPSTETKYHDVHTLYGRCFYDIGEKTFVPAIKNHPNNTTSSSDQEDQLSYLHNVKCVGASHGWLAFIDRRDCSLFLCNPLTTQTIELPPIQTLTAFADGARYRKLDDGSFEIAGFLSKYRWPDEGEILTFSEVIRYLIVEKIILTSSPLERDCMVVLAADSSLAFCKIGDDKWTNLDDGGRGRGCDVVCKTKEKKIYTIQKSSSAELGIWDLSDASSPQITYQTVCERDLDNKLEEWFETEMISNMYVHRYLVESPSSGKLLMVLRLVALGDDENSSDEYPYLNQILKPLRSFMVYFGICKKYYPHKTARFFVFEIDEEKKKLVEVRDLGEMALFVGINHSMAVNAREVPGLIPNAIYFGDTFSDRGVQKKLPPPFSDDGIYDMGDKSVISPYYSTTQSSNHVSPPPVWILH